MGFCKKNIFYVLLSDIYSKYKLMWAGVFCFFPSSSDFIQFFIQNYRSDSLHSRPICLTKTFLIGKQCKNNNPFSEYSEYRSDNQSGQTQIFKSLIPFLILPLRFFLERPT